MIKIGLLSDTHSYIDDKMLVFLEKVDEIWHAGDIGSYEVIERLNNVAKVRAVYGNIDNNIIRQEFNANEVFNLEDIPVYMTHIGGYPDRYAPRVKNKIIKERSKIFISGHSHILKVIYDKKLNCLHLNPGAAGKSGFHTVRTMIRFEIDNTNIQNLEIWEHKR